MRSALSRMPPTWQELARWLEGCAGARAVRITIYILSRTLAQCLYSWLYVLFLGIDANFHLKRKQVSNDIFDPGLGKGYSYFVEETEYKEYLCPRMDTPQEVHILEFR
jgi:hypothetical protein